MLIHIILCYVISIPYIVGNSLSSETPIVQLSKKVLNESHEGYNNTKLNIVSEGGSLLPNTVVDMIQLPKGKHSNLINLDNEIGKNKEKSVVARKGVVYTSSEDMQASLNNTKIAKPFIPTAENGSNMSKEKNYSNLKKITVTSINYKTMGSSNPELINEKDKNKNVPKKPLVLSNEALDQITLKESEVVYPKEGHNKVLKNPNSHPGMVMPIVITILVVPMFAVIGYLGIKRGQEAWKNRHYKRMDFLLDGMYND